jgi:uncharacterized protein (UPF0212 family)
MKGTLLKALSLFWTWLWGEGDMEPITLAVPEARSSFADGDVGWRNRPAATVACPSCETHFDQQYATDVLDCTYCTFESNSRDISELDLIALHCPRCGSTLEHGRRHPDQFDVPQWASCEECSYHWEISHGYNVPSTPNKKG